MTNYLKIDHAKRTLVMDRTFEKKAAIAGSLEYKQLQECRRDYPEYQVIRRTIKKKPNQEHYKGLTYEYMMNYIETHGSENALKGKRQEFEQMIQISKCHSTAYRYPVIKAWFLKNFPEVKDYGIDDKTAEADFPMEPVEQEPQLPAATERAVA